MKIKVLSGIERYENQLTDRLKVTASFLTRLHQKFPDTDLFCFEFYDAKVLMNVGINSVHPPKSNGPIRSANLPGKFGLGLQYASYNLEDTVEWEIKEEGSIALHSYLSSLFSTGFDFEQPAGKIHKYDRVFQIEELRSLFQIK